MAKITIIGERVNSSWKNIARAIEEKDEAYIQEEAEKQLRAGADFIDVNAGTFAEKERHCVRWLVETIRAAVDVKLCIDSSDPEVLREAIEICGGTAMINSITAEKENYAAVLPILRQYDCKVIAMCLDDEGVTSECEKKIRTGCDLVENLLGDGIKADNIYLDPVITAVGADKNSGVNALKTTEEVRRRYPGIHTVCGLGNISFGLPVRKLLNRTLLVMAMAVGVDTVIIDPLDQQMMEHLIAANTLLGNDEFCGEYIAAYRSKRLEHQTD